MRGPIPRSRRRLFADTTPLRTPDFRRLWLTGIVTVIGANLTIFAVPVQLYVLTENSAYVVLSGIFALVPLVAFGPWGGAWADAMDRRLLLIIASCGLAVSSVLLWLQAALALNNVWVLLRWVDLSTLYLVDALTCVAPIWATFRLSPMPPTGTDDGSSRWGLAAVLDGFRYLAGNRVVLMSFVVDLIAMIFGMPRAPFPQIAHESFGGPVEGGTTMALLAAAMSAGAVAGGVFSVGCHGSVGRAWPWSSRSSRGELR